MREQGMSWPIWKSTRGYPLPSETEPTTALLAAQNLNAPLREICQQTEKSKLSNRRLLSVEQAGTMPGRAHGEAHFIEEKPVLGEGK